MFDALPNPADVAGWLTLGGVLALAWIIQRGGGGAALATLEVANRVLERRVRSLEDQGAADKRQIEELRASRDWSAAIQPLIDTVVHHEQNEEQVFREMLGVLTSIAERLEPRGAGDELADS